MKILINDCLEYKQQYEDIFLQRGYERNNLIFTHNFQEAKEIINNELAQKKAHIDLIVTGDTSYTGYDNLRSTELLHIVREHSNSYSSRQLGGLKRGNFRITSIPIIHYSDSIGQTNGNSEFNAVLKRNSAGNHTEFINCVETLIKSWRADVWGDLETIGLAKKYKIIRAKPIGYNKDIAKRSDAFYYNHTKVLSSEFIITPTYLDYEWLTIKPSDIEISIDKLSATIKSHVKYDRWNNERTILHELFLSNPRILLRDSHEGFIHEPHLKQIEKKKSQQCDFILKTDLPKHLRTTFFEVKKENIKLLARIGLKRMKLSSELEKGLEQLDDYREYAEETFYQDELEAHVGYLPGMYDFILLAGRDEEREENKKLVDKKVGRRYSGIQHQTYDDLRALNISYYLRFNKINNHHN